MYISMTHYITSIIFIKGRVIQYYVASLKDIKGKSCNACLKNEEFYKKFSKIVPHLHLFAQYDRKSIKPVNIVRDTLG